MSKTIFVTCPVCQEFMEVNAENGKVIKHQESKTKGKTKDKAFDEALEDTKDRESKLSQQFDSAKLAEKEKLKKLDKLFKEKKKKIDSGEEGEEDKPIRPFDLD